MVPPAARSPRRRRWFPLKRPAVAAWAIALAVHAALIAGFFWSIGGSPGAGEYTDASDWRQWVAGMAGSAGEAIPDRTATMGAAPSPSPSQLPAPAPPLQPAVASIPAQPVATAAAAAAGPSAAPAVPAVPAVRPVPPAPKSQSQSQALALARPNAPAPSVRATNDRAPATRRAERARPSFDCAKARSASDRAICADPELARMDRDLGRLYAQARAAASDPSAFKRQGDREWLRRETTCRGDRDCLRQWYAQRRLQLQGQVRGSHVARR